MRRLLAVVCAVVVVFAVAGCRSESATEEEAGGGGETTETASGPETFGDLESPCGPGDASGATDQGVTDSEINVGTMSDATAELQPGLNEELWDSTDAFVDWCNDQGGILGRTIVDTRYEPKLFEATQATIEACQNEFMLVGGGAAFDDQVAPERVNCGLPEVTAYNATKTATEADLNYPVLPTPFTELSAGEAFYLAQEYPEAVKNAGSLAPDFASAKNIVSRARAAYTAAGWDFIDEQLYNPAAELGWAGIVSRFQSNGVDAIYYTGTYQPLVGFLQAAAQQNWKPSVIIGASTIINQDFLNEAGADAEGVYSYTNIIPWDETSNPATAKYVELIEGAGHEPALLGINSMSAWVLWATAAKACGSDLTRQCVETEIAKQDEWTAGGLHSPSDPATLGQPACFVLAEVIDGGWTRAYPESGFDCDPTYLVPTGDAEYVD